MEVTCLNCEHSIAEKYCSCCGQKTSTHRYSLKHFVEHDFVHGVWHVDKGIVFTIKELFTRPGHSVREFILGKELIISVSLHFLYSFWVFRAYLVNTRKSRCQTICQKVVKLQ